MNRRNLRFNALKALESAVDGPGPTIGGYFQAVKLITGFVKNEDRQHCFYRAYNKSSSKNRRSRDFRDWLVSQVEPRSC